ITDSKIEVQSPGNYAYSIFDYSGKAIKQGNLVNGSNLIQTPGIVSGGMYIIRFNDAAAGIWVDKFIRQ
ncbi:MAG TPA: T9SS type A sorting domain-containing protein, partial [Chitinophagaceae bacterium]|nr:T9SS type A sorting domain-containing protein [Chitinophagaceae bacterium]